MVTPSILASPLSGRWREERRALYHGIPVTLRARSCPDEAWTSAWDHLVRADAIFNRFAPDSSLSRLASAPPAPRHRIEPALAEGLRCAIRAHSRSRRACDASVRPLVALWRQAVADQVWPTAAAITEARSHCRIGDLAVVGDEIIVHGAPWVVDLDLGGVIKGVLVDQVASILRQAGVTDLLIQIGGETTTLGTGPGGRPWRIGLQHPLVGDATWLVLAAPATGFSCSTSADYRRGWTILGAAVSHLIDPRTGQPLADDLLTAHVAIPACGACGDAEALTKAVAMLDLAEADRAVADVGGEWLHLGAIDEGILEQRSPGLADLEAA